MNVPVDRAEAAVEPVVLPLDAPPAIDRALRQFSRIPGCLLLESALANDRLARYSFLCADPFEWHLAAPGDAAPLAGIERGLRSFTTIRRDDLPPFQGGAAGLLGYDLGRSFERVPTARRDEFQAPAVALGLYDVVLAFDRLAERAWIVSQGLPETDPDRRRRRARRRAEWMKSLLEDAPPVAPAAAGGGGNRVQPGPQFPTPRGGPLSSSFSPEGYLQAAARAIEYIHAGDVFQVNLAQRLLYPAVDDSVSLYLRMRERNAATFAGYFDLGRLQIVSASPERLVQVRDGRVEARPIKGTRARTLRPEADLFAGDDLRASEKDRAENVMIVDLLRNDLSRVCRPESVRVTELCGLESYGYVQHLVSAVEGQLSPGQTALDLVRAAFPGGSITGAPKVRAMEIIAELEPTARGPYCGSLGYLGFDGSLDLSILIRTITCGGGWWQFPVGGGIVAQSDPQSEYEETWHKAEGMLRALRP